MGDQGTSESLNDHSEKPLVVDDAERVDAHPASTSQSLRSELITLAEKCEIKHSVAYIKKASHSALEKIKGEYERKQLE